MLKKYLISLFAIAFLCSPVVYADEAAMEQKINKLEKLVESQGVQLQTLQSQRTEQSSHPISDTTIGGYGEIIYNGYHQNSSRDQVDLNRFVLFIGHRFSDRWTFNSEIEWEHAIASADDQGETEVEQAYVNYQMASGANFKTGLFLMPFGFINESHEPPVFYGVERNEIETRIIPTTWREGGVGFDGTTAFGLETKVGIVTGFDVAKFDDASKPLGSIHQELQLAKAHDASFYGALNYKGVPGLNVGGAYFTGNSSQGNADFKSGSPTENPDFADLNARVTLWETHARWQKRGLDFEALYAEGRIGQSGKINEIVDAFNIANTADRSFVPERFSGWLLQTAYTVWQQGDMTLTPFVRYEKFNTQAKMPMGFEADPVNADRVATFGLSFKPLTQIVFKTDYQRYRDNRLNDRFNVGLGYMF